MLKTTTRLVRDYPVVRASTVAILFFGFAGAMVSPFSAVVGIRVLGLSNFAYSVVIFCGAVMNVVASVLMGSLADRWGSFRKPMLVASALGFFGHLLVWAFPSPWVFALASIGPIACFYVINTLLFANIRNHAKGMSQTDLNDAITVVRMAISVAWVLVPGLVALVLSDERIMLRAWALAGMAALGCHITVWRMMPRDHGRADTSGAGPRASALADALRLLSPPVALRLLGVALVTSVLYVNGTILPLIVTGRGQGTMTDVGIIVGMVAGIEALLMLVWAQIARRYDQIATLGAATLLYAIYLIWLGLLTTRWEAYVASIIGGIGAAAIVSQPIGYLLAIIKDRSGLSASLFSINLFVAAGLGAAIFAIGTAFGSYGTVAFLGAVAGLAGIVLLFCLDGWRLRAPAEGSVG